MLDDPLPKWARAVRPPKYAFEVVGPPSPRTCDSAGGRQGRGFGLSLRVTQLIPFPCVSPKSYTLLHLGDHKHNGPPTSILKDMDPAMTKLWWLFSGWIALSSVLFLKPIVALVRLALSQDDASYLLIIPFISAGALYLERHKVFQLTSIDKMLGGAFLLLTGLAALISSHLGT